MIKTNSSIMQLVEDVYRVGKAPAASPTSVLEEDLSDFMTDWSWEAPPPPPRAPVSQPATTSPICGSPLRSSSSSSDADALQRQQKNNPMPTLGVGSKTGPRSLVETLHECLTSLPQSTSTGVMSDPTTSSSSARQSSSRPVGKRRPRVSRRTPTTILETDPSDFRLMVQKLTGMPGATPGAMPVRPRPQRANPVGLQTLRSIRRLPPMGSPARAPPPPPDTTLRRNFSPTRRDELHPGHHLQRTSDHVIQPTTVKPAQAFPFVRACKREFDQMETVDHIAFSDSPPSMTGSPKSLMKRVMSAPMPSMPSWWEHQSQELPEPRSISNLHMTTDANPPFAMSSGCSSPSSSCYSIDSLARENFPQSEFVPMDSADGQLAEEEQEFNFSQIESWLSAESTMNG